MNKEVEDSKIYKGNERKKEKCMKEKERKREREREHTSVLIGCM